MALRHRRLILLGLLALPILSIAGEEEDAESAVNRIRCAVSSRAYDDLYDNLTSEYFKAKSRRSDFIQNLKQGRATVGAVVTTTSLFDTYSDFDSQTGYRGKIYSFDFHVKYERAAFFERIVVTKDPDGRYRLAGLWANPAPN